MITARRFYIDQFMKDNNKLFQGKIIDIGGVRSKFRGNFKFNKVQERNRKIINNRKDVNPDYLISIEDPININEKFDIIVVNEVIEYIENLDNLFVNILNLSHDKSLLIMTWPWMNTFHGDKEKDLKRYSKVFIKNLLYKYDFRIQFIDNNGGFFSVIWDFLHTLSNNTNNYFFRRMIKIFLKFSFRFALLIDKLIDSSEHITTGFTLVAMRN